MGAVLSQAASGAGAFLGNLVTAPLKSIFGASCDEICSGPWDVGCFVEHLCISDLFKFVLLLALCYIILVFVYLLLKVGIFQCMTKTLCKMCWTGFAAYCYALRDIICCLSGKLTRVRRRRRRDRPHFNDIERGGEVGDISSSDGYSGGNSRKRMREDGKAMARKRRRRRRRRVARLNVSSFSSSRRLRSSRRIRVIKGGKKNSKPSGGISKRRHRHQR